MLKAQPSRLIKACVTSEVAAVKSQPRAHLFKRGNNEFFVASHLPITINLAFCRYLHSEPDCTWPLDWNHTHSIDLPMTDLQLLTLRMMAVHEFYRLPQVSSSCYK